MKVAMRRASAILSVGVLATATGCDDSQTAESSRPVARDRNVLTVFASLPAHGSSRAAADDAETGMRAALDKAGGRAGRYRIRFVRLSSTRPGAEPWDREAIAANAWLAANEPSTIAYIGELDLGGSTVSLPITNRAGIVQVSPADGLTSLGRALPSAHDDESLRYSPSGKLNFVRLVPPDLDSTRRIADSIVARRPRRLAVLHDGGIASREATELVLFDVRAELSPKIVRVPIGHGGRRQATAVVRRTLAARPDLILYTGGDGATSRAVLEKLGGGRLNGTPVIGGPPLGSAERVPRAPVGACAWSGIPTPKQLSAKGRRMLTRMRAQSDRHLGTQAVLGYASMRLVLNAIGVGGANRGRVVRAARANVDWDEVAVGYGLGNRAHVEPLAVACHDLGGR